MSDNVDFHNSVTMWEGLVRRVNIRSGSSQSVSHRAMSDLRIGEMFSACSGSDSLRNKFLRVPRTAAPINQPPRDSLSLALDRTEPQTGTVNYCVKSVGGEEERNEESEKLEEEF